MNGYVRKLQSISIAGISPLIRALFRHRNLSERRSVPAPIFIVGAPRTGSTILYQAITNAFDVLYFDNLSARWHRTPLFGLKLSHRRYGSAPHNSFTSSHGVTEGGHAPNECGEFWYRWFPRDQHFVADAPEKVILNIRREINETCAVFGKPFVFKNLNAGQRLRVIARAFPDARIIFIRRDPRFVLRSILLARRRLGIGAGRWWSVRPPGYEKFLGLTEMEMCAAQIFQIEKQILEDIELFPESNVHMVEYDSLSQERILHLGAALGLRRRANGKLPEFSKDNEEKLSKAELAALTAVLQPHVSEQQR